MGWAKIYGWVVSHLQQLHIYLMHVLVFQSKKSRKIMLRAENRRDTCYWQVTYQVPRYCATVLLLLMLFCWRTQGGLVFPIVEAWVTCTRVPGKAFWYCIWYVCTAERTHVNTVIEPIARQLFCRTTPVTAPGVPGTSSFYSRHAYTNNSGTKYVHLTRYYIGRVKNMQP